MKFLKFLLLILVFILTTYAQTSENKTFIATDEWQEVREGEHITAGLHVRINLTSGKKEAKLLNEEREESALTDLKVDTTTNKEIKKDNFKISQTLKQAIKDANVGDRLSLDYNPEKQEKIRKQYKSYEELKQMRKHFKTDAEIIIQLISEYHNVTTETPSPTEESTHLRRLRILEDFNYLLHQMDNALTFIDVGGLDNILLKLLVNETNIGLKVQSMRVLGALVQNNPQAQIKVFEKNFGSFLAQILSTSNNAEELSTALYAFGSLLRKFPHAQQRLLSTSGMQALMTVLSKPVELKIKAKVATLISDLILEKELALAADDEPLAIAQYAEINLNEWLHMHGYCETMDSVFTQTSMLEYIEQPDILEYMLQALSSTHKLCSTLWTQSPQMKHVLLTLKARFAQSKDEFHLELAERLAQLLLEVYQRGMPHEEL